MALIYNAKFDKNTRKLSFEDKAGNEIYSFTVPERAPAVDDITKPLTFRATQDGSTVALTKNSAPTGAFQTSGDGGSTWTDYTIGSKITLNTGDEVSFRAKSDRTSAQSDKNYFSFQMTGKIEAWHNVMSLYRTNDFATYKSVVDYAFRQLFDGCTSLVKAPVLPTTTLASNCYYGMFKGCSSLKSAPALQATTLANNCYVRMFEGCTSLTKAPELPATTLSAGCYGNMFNGCRSLTKAPELPATTLANYCYREMFKGCTSLTEAPALQATTLYENCYYGMFLGCTSLTKAPVLPATTLANYCYLEMFKGCSSLNEVHCKIPSSYSSSQISSTYAENWLLNVASTGTFYTNADANWPSGASGIPENWTRVNEIAKDDITKPLTFKSTQDGSTVTLTWTISPIDCQTSRDGGKTWVDYTLVKAITLNAGEEVSFRAKANRTSKQSSDDYFYFEMTGKIEAWHNVMSMYRTNDFATFNAVVSYSFYKSFNGCTSLTKAPALPATKLANNCYQHMFYGCTSITEAPELTATTLANNCYDNMFYGCTSLTKAPALPATTLTSDCYYGMFGNCTSLTEAPALPATTLANNGYTNMFNGCTSLTKSPALPATTLANNCYQNMFNGCTSLTKAPALPATTLAKSCYNSMFCGCTSITEAPELTATTLANNCYDNMFRRCTSLTKAPALPATGLYTYCYRSMFNGCTSLTKAPALPATTLADHCYEYMFRGCSSLNEVRCQMPSSYSSSQISFVYAENWLEGVSSTGTFYTNADANWSSGVSGIPTGWTRVNEVAPTANDITKPLTFKATQNGSSVKLTKAGTPVGDFQTSRDGGNTWTDYTLDTAITLNTGDEVSFRAKADRTSAQDYNKYFQFMMEGKIEAWHNVMSLYRTSDFATYESVVDYAFYRIFYGCTSLTKAPVLPATTLANYCYRGMFNGCTSLTEAPELTATTLPEYCYSDMFMGCTSLVNAPALPATTLYRYCYMGLFNGCTSLTKAPVLPATTLASSCYASMFGGCTSLVEAPVLPATTLASGCYQYMFKRCTSMTKAPELPATTLADYCYLQMFNGCSSLNEVRCNMPSSYSSSQISSTYAENWLEGVSSTGTFYTNADANWPSGVSGIPTGWTRVNEGAPTVNDKTKPLTFRATQNGSTVTLKKNGLPEGAGFQTSRDGGNTWEDYTIDSAIALNTGDKVSFRAKADRTFEQSDLEYFYFTMTGKIEAWHNVMSLYRTSDFATYESVMKFAFYYLFKDCTSLTKAPRLPATTLAKSCYRRMFDGCTSLTEAPYLPATALAETCYWGMFGGCTSLTEVPVLQATRLGTRCYNQMFSGCSSLNEVHCYIPSSYSTEYVSAHADGWLSNVASTGTFYTNADANWSPGKVSGIPEGWTRVNS